MLVDVQQNILHAGVRWRGLLVVGEVPGAPVVGETLPAGALGEGRLLEVA